MIGEIEKEFNRDKDKEDRKRFIFEKAARLDQHVIMKRHSRY